MAFISRYGGDIWNQRRDHGHWIRGSSGSVARLRSSLLEFDAVSRKRDSSNSLTTGHVAPDPVSTPAEKARNAQKSESGHFVQSG